jgi:hypothetical protein
LRLCVLAVAIGVFSLVAVASARQPHPSKRRPQELKTVRYSGYAVHVPRSWSVYDLGRQRSVCVRFNRHAVYLGTPTTDQRCPAHIAGRTEAILLEPLRASVVGSGGAVGHAVRAVSAQGAQRGQGSAGQLTVPNRRVLAIATWGDHAALIRRALGLHSIAQLRPIAGPSGKSHAARARPAAVARAVYTGLGFDACATPSSSAMAAWGASQYRAVGVYVGGTNMACAQPNLTSTWVATETNAGWHLIPLYVGLQAPSNSCGCQGIAPSNALGEGTAAATDAVRQAAAVGIGPGSPIYFDMENYSRTATNSSAVLTFLSGWTTGLHSQGYASGVYSNPGSGIADLVSRLGSGYPEPDDIWFANWNGQQTTSDPSIPSGDFANHQRLHQYQGGHNETHGGVTISIDGDYLDGATAGFGTVSVASAPPANYSGPSVKGAVKVTSTLSASAGGWSGGGISFSYQWQRCAPGCGNIGGATGPTYKLAQADLGAMVRVLVTATNSKGVAQATTGAVGPVAPIGYWLYTARGGVYASAGASWLGSLPSRRVRTTSIVGMASTVDGRGYWLASSSGRTYAFGDAPKLRSSAHGHRVVGIVGDPRGGYWLFTASGNVYRSSGAGWFGSAAARHAQTPIVGMASSADGRGYWMVSSSGRVYAFGDASKVRGTPPRRSVAGIVASPRNGYWLFSTSGNVFRGVGAGWFGSVAAHRIRKPSIVAMAPTADGRGYWLVSSSGRVYPFGDAARLAIHGSAIRGIVAQR